MKGLDDETAAQEDSQFRAFGFGIENRNSRPSLVVVVFSHEKELTVMN